MPNKKKSFTIMIIPHAGSNPLNFHITRASFFRIMILLSLVGLLLSLLIIDYNNIKMSTALGPLQEQLSRERKLLAEEKIKQQEEIRQIRGLMARLREFETKLRSITGLKPTVQKGGQGGPTYNNYIKDLNKGKKLTKNIKYDELEDILGESLSIINDFELLEKSVNYQSRELEELSNFLDGEKEVLAYTPLIWPVKGGYISGRFGYRNSPFDGESEFHTGLDISAGYRSPIIATANGKVIYAGWSPGLGNTVKIKHNYGFITTYGHNFKLLVKTGEIVKRGQKIAILGNTGRTTGPHLHYEVQKKGHFENPIQYMLD